jgi:protein TonB
MVVEYKAVSADPHSGPTDASPFAGVRTILVPPDIVAVERRSPAPLKKKLPPWRPRPNAGPTERAGGREWFSDRLFVETQNGRIRGGLGASIGVHVLVATFLVVLTTQFERTMVVRVHSRMVMPAQLLMPPISDAPSRGPKSVAHSTPASPPSDGAPAPGERPPAPVEIPTSIEPETGIEGSLDGVEGGVAGGTGDGSGGEAASLGPPSSGPLRLGSTLAPPRKIKDVRPMYPPAALSTEARGTVIIEVTIGTDGRVHDAKVIHSVPKLDQAALEAVRQWEYEPTRLNGALVGLIMTVVVNFAIQ